jgi:hypothetical protein
MEAVAFSVTNREFSMRAAPRLRPVSRMAMTLCASSDNIAAAI